MLLDIRATDILGFRLLPVLLVSVGCMSPVELDVPAADDSGVAVTDDTGRVEDTGNALRTCSADDLSWATVVLDQDGQALDSVEVGVPVVIAGRVSNPCHEAVTLELPVSCLVEAFDIVDLDTGGGEYRALDCLPTSSKTEVPPGGWSETLLGWVGSHEGAYRITTWFSVEQQSATTTISAGTD